MADIQTQLPVSVTDGTNTVAITGTSAFKIDLSATASNTNAVLVTGTVTASPTGTYTVNVANTVTTSPTGTQTVAGTVTIVPSGTQTVVQASGSTITAVQSGTWSVVEGETSTGIVTYFNTATGGPVASLSTGTISYTVTAGKTLYLKSVMASASGAPCRVQVDYGATPTIICVGFFASSSPFLDMEFSQPISIPATTVVNVKIQNNANKTQDVYATIYGHEI